MIPVHVMYCKSQHAFVYSAQGATKASRAINYNLSSTEVYTPKLRSVASIVHGGAGVSAASREERQSRTLGLRVVLESHRKFVENSKIQIQRKRKCSVSLSPPTWPRSCSRAALSLLNFGLD